MQIWCLYFKNHRHWRFTCKQEHLLTGIHCRSNLQVSIQGTWILHVTMPEDVSDKSLDVNLWFVKLKEDIRIRAQMIVYNSFWSGFHSLVILRGSLIACVLPSGSWMTTRWKIGPLFPTVFSSDPLRSKQSSRRLFESYESWKNDRFP